MIGYIRGGVRFVVYASLPVVLVDALSPSCECDRMQGTTPPLIYPIVNLIGEQI